MDNKKTHTSGQWTELNLQELDLVFASGKWSLLNGYSGWFWDKHLFSRPLTRAEMAEAEAEAAAAGQEAEFNHQNRQIWRNGVNGITNMKMGVGDWKGQGFGQYVFWKDNGVEWARKLRFGIVVDGYPAFPL